jgi:hypothetical protein
LRRDLRTESRVLFLIIHYELGNYDLLEYAVKSTYRYLRKMKSLKGIESLILLFIKKLSSVSERRGVIDLLMELKESLLTFKEELMDYGFNYLAWIDSKNSGVKYSDAVKKMFESPEAKSELELQEV